MSVVFSMAVQNLPSPGEFVQELSQELVDPNAQSMADTNIVICSELAEGADENVWEEGYRYTFYISNLSTRGLEIWTEHSTLHVRVLTMSSVDEWWLALRFLEMSAQSPTQLVTNDWKPEKYSIGNLRELFEEEFFFDALHRQSSTLFEGAMQRGLEYNLHGPYLPFHFGPWLAHRITSHFPGEDSWWDIVNFTQDLMRIVQFLSVRICDRNYGAPMMMDFPVDGTNYTAAVINTGEFFVPKVDFLILPDKKTGLMALPSEEFKSELPKYFKEVDQLLWLDEHQFGLANYTQMEFYRFAKGVEDLCHPVTTHYPPGQRGQLQLVEFIDLAAR